MKANNHIATLLTLMIGVYPLIAGYMCSFFEFTFLFCIFLIFSLLRSASLVCVGVRQAERDSLCVRAKRALVSRHGGRVAQVDQLLER